MNPSALLEVFEKTNGHCHFCGDPITFRKRGWSPRPNGNWEVDHVVQRRKGGERGKHNCLPACTVCNRLRWGRTGDGLRELLLLGVIAVKEIRAGSRLGAELEALRDKRLRENRLRRRNRRLLAAESPRTRRTAASKSRTSTTRKR
jgi:hypothetical protein